MSEAPRMDIKEFREKGYLQEVNRRFLHRVGLALAVNVEDDGTETLACIYDDRDDPEGWCYSPSSDEDTTEKRKQNAKFIDDELEKRRWARVNTETFETDTAGMQTL